jgi:NhaP-type Na+/H+ or K+/H+ antiporter
VTESVLIGIAVCIVAGIGAQWLARRLQIPAILLLLAAGVVVGPITGLVVPERMFGAALLPFVSLAVGLLLFEGGLSLRLRQLRSVRRPVVLLCTVGVLVTFALGALGAAAVLPVPREIAVVVAAILVVSGPTVVDPLLAYARPTARVAEILRWEGIVIDPVGATFSVAVLNVLLHHQDPLHALLATSATGVATGMFGAAVYVAVGRRRWVPRDLEVPIMLLVVVASFAFAERRLPEAGLFATTTVGVTLANQNLVPTEHLEPFFQSVRVVVLGTLFAVLGALVELPEVAAMWPGALALTAFLVIVVRPVVAFLCTIRSGLPLRERAFVALMAPRGIVAAATASLFALKLGDTARTPGPLDEIVFLAIVGTCLFYGAIARPVARALGVAQAPARTVALVGSAPWLRALAGELQRLGAKVNLVTSSARPEDGAKPTLAPLAELDDAQLLDTVEQVVLASDDPDENLLAALRYGMRLDAGRVLVLAPSRPPPPGSESARLATWHPRLFDGRLTRQQLEDAMADGHRLVACTVPGEGWSPVGRLLARVLPDGRVDLTVRARHLRPGDRLVVLVPPPSDRGGASGDRHASSP